MGGVGDLLVVVASPGGEGAGGWAGASIIAVDDLDENVDETATALSVMLYAVERHATVIIPTKSSRNDRIKRQIFAATPSPTEGYFAEHDTAQKSSR